MIRRGGRDEFASSSLVAFTYVAHPLAASTHGALARAPPVRGAGAPPSWRPRKRPLAAGPSESALRAASRLQSHGVGALGSGSRAPRRTARLRPRDRYAVCAGAPYAFRPGARSVEFQDLGRYPLVLRCYLDIVWNSSIYPKISGAQCSTFTLYYQNNR
jgi:hypothetical protein